MSRHSYGDGGDRYNLCYGIDRAPAIGPFVQVFDREDPDEIPIVDLDRLGGVEVTADMILSLADKYGVRLEPDTVRRHMSADPPRFEQAPPLKKICDDVLRLAQKDRGDA
jgi:hypothetical protein